MSEWDSTRRSIEKYESWDIAAKSIKPFNFSHVWAVTPLPPTGGVAVRFTVRHVERNRHISVYFDYTGFTSGYTQSCFWEALFDEEDDIHIRRYGDQKDLEQDIDIFMDDGIKSLKRNHHYE